MTDPESLGVDEYRALLDNVFDQQIVEWTAEAEASERFPRKLIEHLGRIGVFAHKWGAVWTTTKTAGMATCW